MNNDIILGEDETTTEIIKGIGPVGMQWLYRLIKAICRRNHCGWKRM